MTIYIYICINMNTYIYIYILTFGYAGFEQPRQGQGEPKTNLTIILSVIHIYIYIHTHQDVYIYIYIIIYKDIIQVYITNCQPATTWVLVPTECAPLAAKRCDIIASLCNYYLSILWSKPNFLVPLHNSYSNVDLPRIEHPPSTPFLRRGGLSGPNGKATPFLQALLQSCSFVWITFQPGKTG